MPGRVGVFGRMPVGRAVAAQGDPALLADAQVNPRRTDLHTLGTFLLDRVLYRFNRTNVCTATVAAHEVLYSAIARSTTASALESGATREDADTLQLYPMRDATVALAPPRPRPSISTE